MLKLVLMPPQSERTIKLANRVKDSVPDILVVTPEDDSSAITAIADADAAIGTIPKQALSAAKSLRWIQGMAAGPPEGYYYPELVEHPVVITNSAGIFGEHIGAHIMAFILGLSRGFQFYFPQQSRQEWKRLEIESTVYLPEATVLMVGVGGIGAAAAEMCANFGIRVIGVDARRTDAPPGVAELHHSDQLESLLPEADFVVLTVPLTPETKGMMSARQFGLMKSSSFLINIGRGGTVVLDDLVDALNTGDIAGAGIDVFEIEPLPENHPLWKAPGLLLTPHRAAVGPYTNERRMDLIIDNCRRFVGGEPLRNVVDKANWF
jgi:phosphoglycerate dehydrogenase-like enzyme